MELTIVVFFWLFLFPLIHNLTAMDYFININVHGVYGLFLFLELFYNHIPFQKETIKLLLILEGVYFIVNLSATLISGTPVYTPITYKDVKTYVLIAVATAIFIGAFYLGYLFFHRFKVPRKETNIQEKDFV